MVQPPLHASKPPALADGFRENDVFISYSRRDKAFVEQLDAKFRQAGRDPWVDWDDIRKGEDWWKSIQRGIEESDSFVFVISPDSVTSTVCREEIDYAAQLNKRFLPLLWREGFEMSQVHRSISQHNWIFARETDDFQTALQELLTALETDLNYVRTHTRLLVRSLEWRNRQQNSSYLLRGIDLEDARSWIAEGINKQPRPTDDQVSYINASLETKAAALKARQKAKWIVVLTTVIANLAFVAAGLSAIYWQVNTVARQRVEQTMQETLKGAIAGINGAEFAQLAQVKLPPGQLEPVNNPLYQKHQDWLKTIHQIAPAALPTTYLLEPNQRIVAIGDICRVIADKQAHPYRMIVPDGEIIPARFEGFQEISINLSPYKDRFGKSWVSIYGPIRNRSGQVVGALGLAYESTYWTNLEDKIRRLMTIAYGLAFLWLVISSWLILRATQPSQEIKAGSKRPYGR
jgi:TIR domain